MGESRSLRARPPDRRTRSGPGSPGRPALAASPRRRAGAPGGPHVLPLPGRAAPAPRAPRAPHSPELRRGAAGRAPAVGSRAGPWAAPPSAAGRWTELRDVRGQEGGRRRGRPGTRQWRRFAAACAPGTLQAGGSATSPAEGRSRRRSRSGRRGRGRPGPEGERAGQRRSASAHCCRARRGAAGNRPPGARAPLRAARSVRRPRTPAPAGRSRTSGSRPPGTAAPRASASAGGWGCLWVG